MNIIHSVPVELNLMKNTKTMFIFACALAVSVQVPGNTAEPVPFSRYEIIVDRQPFGRQPEPAPEPVPEQAPVVQDNALAQALRLTALWELDGSGIRAGLVDVQSNQAFTLRVGQTDLGYELLSADYANEEAMVRRGGQYALLRLETATSEVTTAAATSRSNAAEVARRTYEERRQERIRAATVATAPAEPRLRGEEMSRHLEEYNMQVIREGLPPLPIELTPEQDQQLVDEGVLQPR